jgi:hypothetical protein
MIRVFRTDRGQFAVFAEDALPLWVISGRSASTHVRFSPEADLCDANRDVCFEPIADIERRRQRRHLAS